MYRWTVRLLVAALLMGFPAQYPGVRAEPTGARLSGTIFSGDQREPVAGAKLLVGDPRTGRIYTSTPTGQDGRFAVGDLPAATYELAVEARGGLYPTRGPIQLAAGQKQEVQLALAAPASPPGTPPPTDTKELPGAKTTVWSNPLTATLIVVGVAVVVGVALESATDNNSSPSTP